MVDWTATTNSMDVMVLLLITLTIGFAGGFYAGVKNAGSSKVAKAKSLADEFAGK